MSPAARSLRYLRGLGYWPEMVERWVPFVASGEAVKPGELAGVRRDLWHCVDIEALGEGHVLYVQVTTIGELAEHVGKIQGLAEFDLIKRAAPGVRFQVHAWDDKSRPVGLKIIDMMRLVTVLDSRVMVGRSSKARKLHQMPLI